MKPRDLQSREVEAQKLRKGIGKRKRLFVAYFVANPDTELCYDCIRTVLCYARSVFTEKYIRESALEAGLSRRLGQCMKCQKNRPIISTK
jgi:hypothetical protein